MFKQGMTVRVLSKPTGCTSQHADVEVGELGVVQYIDGCCLCVKTERDEYTANQTRFEPVNEEK